jgi:hypothetical protein
VNSGLRVATAGFLLVFVHIRFAGTQVMIADALGYATIVAGLAMTRENAALIGARALAVGLAFASLLAGEYREWLELGGTMLCALVCLGVRRLAGPGSPHGRLAMVLTVVMWLVALPRIALPEADGFSDPFNLASAITAVGVLALLWTGARRVLPEVAARTRLPV